MASNCRIGYIDTAKGIGISLVVLFHMSGIDSLKFSGIYIGWITSFYMVFFFSLSGLFFKPSGLNRRLKSLLKPYFVFLILAYFYYISKSLITHSVCDYSAIIYPLLGSQDKFLNPPLWFLIALCFLNIVASILAKIQNKIYSIVLAIIIGLIAYIYGKLDYPNYYHLGSALLCVPFFWITYIYRDYLLRKWHYAVGIFCLAFSFVFYCAFKYGCNVSLNIIPPYHIFCVIAISASAGLFIMSLYIDKIRYINDILRFFGRNSLIVLCTHIPLLAVQGVIGRLLHSHEIGYTLLLTSFFVIMILEYIIIRFINKYLFFIIK